MRGIVDRFEADKVLLEIGEEGILVFDKELFPEEIKEGDIVKYVNDSFIIDKKATKERSSYINNLFRSLTNKKE